MKLTKLIINAGIIIGILIMTYLCVNMIIGDSFKNAGFSDDYRLKVKFTSGNIQYYSEVRNYDVVQDTPSGLIIDVNYKDGHTSRLTDVLSVDYCR